MPEKKTGTDASAGAAPLVADNRPFWARLAAAQRNYKKVVANKTATIKSARTGKEFTYKYADLNDVLDATRPALNDQGLAVTQDVVFQDHRMVCTTRISLSSEEYVTGTFSLPEPAGEGVGAQDFGRVLSYVRRYSYNMTAGVAVAEEDTDANRIDAETGEAEPIESNHRQPPRHERKPDPDPKSEPETNEPGPTYTKSGRRNLGDRWKISLDELKELQVVGKLAGFIDGANQDKFLDEICRVCPEAKLPEDQVRPGRRLAWDKLPWGKYDELYKSFNVKAQDRISKPEPEPQDPAPPVEAKQADLIEPEPQPEPPPKHPDVVERAANGQGLMKPDGTPDIF